MRRVNLRPTKTRETFKNMNFKAFYTQSVLFSLMILGLSAQPSSAAEYKFLYATDGKRTLSLRKPSQLKGNSMARHRRAGSTPGLGFSFGREWVFINNVEVMKTTKYDQKKGLTGWDFINSLKSYSKAACIPSLLVGGHGWGSPLAGDKVDSIAKGSQWRDSGKGFYLDGAKRPGINTTLKAAVEAKTIRFCNQCEIYLHACSISKEFASSLSKVSGCNVIAADFKVSPVDPGSEGERDIGQWDHIWFTSGKGNFFEYLPNGQRKVIGQSFIFDPSLRL